MKHRLLLFASTIAIACIGAGCFRTTVYSGKPPGPAASGHDQRWHHGYVAGIIEGSGPYALDRACPSGWAEVKAKTDPLDVLLTLVTLTIYTPQVTTIVCAEPGGPDTPPPEGYRVPPLTSASAYPTPSTGVYPPPAPPPDPFD